MKTWICTSHCDHFLHQLLSLSPSSLSPSLSPSLTLSLSFSFPLSLPLPLFLLSSLPPSLFTQGVRDYGAAEVSVRPENYIHTAIIALFICCPFGIGALIHALAVRFLQYTCMQHLKDSTYVHYSLQYMTHVVCTNAHYKIHDLFVPSSHNALANNYCIDVYGHVQQYK